MDVFGVTEGVLPGQEKRDGHADRNANAGSHGEEANRFQRAISAWRGARIPVTYGRFIFVTDRLACE